MAKLKPWQERWFEDAAELSLRRKGGQGFIKFVRPVNKIENILYVLKILKEQKTPERRARMRREIVALETLRHPATPKIIESNTEKYLDTSIDLYAVFEYIPGPTLTEFIADKKSLPLTESLELILSILRTLEEFHKVGIVHRDIKPDNVIVKNGDFRDVILLDFGLTFNENQEDEEITPDYFQVGNRFIVLPEQSAFSPNKRDPRSDLTACVGLLYFALTGSWPGHLSDESALPPHQRSKQRSILDQLPYHERNRILHVFDLGFDRNLARRWQTAKALREQLETLARGAPNESETDVAVIRLQERAAAIASNKQIIQALDQTRRRLEVATHMAAQKLGDGHTTNIEHRLASMLNMDTYIRCGIDLIYEGRTVNIPFIVRAIGEEVIVEQLFDGYREIRARIPIAVPQAFPDLENMIMKVIISKVDSEIS